MGRVAAAAVEDDGEVTKELSRNVERHLDRLVELLDLGRPTSPHSALEATAWNGQDVVQVGNGSDREPLPPAQSHFGRQSTDRAGDERHDDRSDGLKNGISSKKHDGAVPHRGR